MAGCHQAAAGPACCAASQPGPPTPSCTHPHPSPGTLPPPPPLYRREYVVQVLMKVVEGTTVDDAVNIMQEAHVNGLALVAQCAQVRRPPARPPPLAEGPGSPRPACLPRLALRNPAARGRARSAVPTHPCCLHS